MQTFMKSGWFVGWAGCLVLAAATAGSDDLGSDETAIRTADAAQRAAVRAGRFDGLPTAIRDQMRLSGSSLDWQPTRIDIARSADLAYETATYEMGFRSPGGSPLTDRGTLLRVWKKQAGEWQVAAEAWNSSPAAPDGVAPPANPPTAAPAAAERAVPDGDYGAPPAHYQQAIDQYFQRMLKHPESVEYGAVTPPEKGSATVEKGMFARNLRELGWRVAATINAKNADGRYVGFKTYVFLFRGEKIVSAKAPTPDGEMNF